MLYSFGRVTWMVAVKMARQGDSCCGKWGTRLGRRTIPRCSVRGTHAYTFPTPECALRPRTLTSKWHTRPLYQPASSQPRTPAWELPPTDHQLPLSPWHPSVDAVAVVLFRGGCCCQLVVGGDHYHRVESSGWRH